MKLTLGEKRSTAEIKKGKLVYDGIEFAQKEEVIVETELTNEELLGQITSIKNDEIYITLLDDTKVRLLLPHLQAGRCRISKNPESLK